MICDITLNKTITTSAAASLHIIVDNFFQMLHPTKFSTPTPMFIPSEKQWKDFEQKPNALQIKQNILQN
jgi:hypothetical protein